MKYIYAAAAALCAGLAAADIAYPTPTVIEKTFTNEGVAQSVYDKLSSDLNAYQTSVAAKPEYSQFVSALSSAAGSDFSLIINTNLDGNNLYSLTQDTATPTWWTKLPTSAQAFATSIYADEVSIESKDILGAAAATPAPIYKAAAVAGAGALAGAALLL